MQVVAIILAFAAVASAGLVSTPIAYSAPTVISRAPAFDSAVIKSDRLGGNFAYSVAENHAYAAHTPIVQHVTSPVGVTYAAGAPVVTGYSAPAIHAYAAPLAFGGVVRSW
ncbi:pupal cuticle protein G1A [Folsomia candida]|uniref:Vacuolar protein-sorting protein bro1 n=1 Tax=Folsomia candida TaxID=158441 RepID=A0A226F5Y9_FOLCA|nr:pupal cuticle protein G1A [Folsomia candida]OXA64854.1 Vacuolar protein-sorting protein bro1 [Folsomia candida]